MKVNFRENIAVLHSIIDGVPDHLINLRYYKTDQPCGTICCGAGWAAMHPYFQKQGLMLDKSLPRLGNNPNPSTSLAALFGNHAFSELFEKRTDGVWDSELLRRGMTDKQLLLARLRKGYYQHAPSYNA